MAKQRNQLYQNPDKVFAHEAGATVHIIQPIKFNGRKICTPMFIAHDFYRGLSSDYEKAADELLSKIAGDVAQSEKDLPWADEVDTYNFLDRAIHAVIYGYTSAEAMANFHIRERGAPEHFDLDVGRKLSVVLPEINKKPRLPEDLWNQFGKYEELRKQMIHPLFEDFYNPNLGQWSTTLIFKLFDGWYKGVSVWAQRVSQHFSIPAPAGPAVFHNVVRGLQPDPLPKERKFISKPHEDSTSR